MPTERRRLTVRGLVQGVGFRPFVYRLAEARGLAGVVRNTEGGVVVEVEGPAGDLDGFARSLASEAPPLARVDSVAEERIAVRGDAAFRIDASGRGGAARTAVPPDVATCDACLREMGDPADRRHRYPFVNCTDCGPRFSIVEGVPYDRERTTMREFRMCPDCLAEYWNPLTRRFHAEPDACPECGPEIRLEAPGVDGRDGGAALAEAARRLAAGETVAVKGLGGFHLAADARNEVAVARLRARKQRDRKPFAVLVADLAAASALARVSPGEGRLLLSPARPIVLLRALPGGPLAPSVAPGLAVLGVMLPYTPLHHLLLQAFADATPGAAPPVLVLTSANPREEPIVRGNAEARERLAGIADAFLLHDREILARCDDSVAMDCGGPSLLRRSRGFVPLPVALPAEGPPVLAMGGDLKNCFCLTRGDEAFPGPHVGDLENVLTAEYLVEAIRHLANLLDVRPSVIVHDLHPDYRSTRIARQLGEGPFRGARLLAVQHHHAHVLSCLAENGHRGPALGLALDGAGHGTDGASWGGEVLAVDGLRFERIAHLSPLRLPGGDLAAREVWRLAVAALCDLGAGHAAKALAERWPSAPGDAVEAILGLCRSRAPLPASTSLGRLFDAAAAILGIRDEATYEGEAAIALEQAAGDGTLPGDPYPAVLDPRLDPIRMDTGPILGGILEDALRGVDRGLSAARFHATVIGLLARGVAEASRRTGLRIVALSGGCLQNRILLEGLTRTLGEAGFAVLAPSAVPANDGGLALGQAFAGMLPGRDGADPPARVRGNRDGRHESGLPGRVPR